MGEHDNEIRRESGREASRETGRRLKYSRTRYRRVFLIITDLMGIGGAPDAAAYGDAAADTMARLAGSPEKPDVRNLRNLGLFNMKRIPGVDPVTYMMGRYMPLFRKSGGTDLTAGIRELMGILPAEDAEPEGTKPEERGLPGSVTVPAALKAAGLDLFSAGTVREVFGNEEFPECLCRERGMEAMAQVIKLTDRDFHGLCFADVGEDEASRTEPQRSAAGDGSAGTRPGKPGSARDPGTGGVHRMVAAVPHRRSAARRFLVMLCRRHHLRQFRRKTAGRRSRKFEMG